MNNKILLSVGSNRDCERNTTLSEFAFALMRFMSNNMLTTEESQNKMNY
jgi:hypothetical protein